MNIRQKRLNKLFSPTQSASIDRGIGGELSCLCHSSSASVQYSARSIEYYSPTPVLYNVSIVQPAVFIPILSNIQPLTILSTIQQLFPTKNSFILHSSQANKTPKKQFARRIFKIPFKKKWWDFWLLSRGIQVNSIKPIHNTKQGADNNKLILQVFCKKNVQG